MPTPCLLLSAGCLHNGSSLIISKISEANSAKFNKIWSFTREGGSIVKDIVKINRSIWYHITKSFKGTNPYMYVKLTLVAMGILFFG